MVICRVEKIRLRQVSPASSSQVVEAEQKGGQAWVGSQGQDLWLPQVFLRVGEWPVLAMSP